MARSEQIDEKAWPEIAHFADTVKAIRVERGMTGKELAALIGVGAPYITHLENRRVNPTLQQMAWLAGALKVPLSLFILDRNEKQPAPARPFKED